MYINKIRYLKEKKYAYLYGEPPVLNDNYMVCGTAFRWNITVIKNIFN